MMTERLKTLAQVAEEAVKQSPALAARLALAGVNAGDLVRPGVLDSIPVFQKTELMAQQAETPPFAGYLSAGMDEIAHIFVSPGPIFEPVLRGHGAHGFDQMFHAGGLGSGDIALNTWSYHLVPAGLVFDAAARATGATVIPSGPGQTDLQATLIKKVGVTAFLGSTAYFEKVAEVYATTYGGTKDHWSIKRAFLGGEPGDWMGKRARLEVEHGVKTYGAYGTADLGLVGFEEDGQAGYKCNLERLVQICDPTSGVPLPIESEGQVVVTTLTRGWPMMRFGTGDLARALALSDDGFVSRMSGVTGRVGDGVKVREIFVYASNATALAQILGHEVQASIRVWREDGVDRITIEITGTNLSDTEVREAFHRLTRLRVDYIRRLKKVTIPSLLEDSRVFGPISRVF